MLFALFLTAQAASIPLDRCTNVMVADTAPTANPLVLDSDRPPVRLGDLDGDGIEEVAVFNWHGGIDIRLSDNFFPPISPNLFIDSPLTLVDIHDYKDIVAADLNADGHPDLIAGRPDALLSRWGSSGIVDIWFGPFTPGTTLSFPADAELRGDSDYQLGRTLGVLDDLDGNGSLELVVGDNDSLGSSLRLYDAGLLTPGASLSIDDFWLGFAPNMYDGFDRARSAGDVTGDGVADLLLDGVSGATVVPGPVAGGGWYAGQRTLLSPLTPAKAWSGFDADSDGINDIAMFDGHTGTLRLFYGGTFDEVWWTPRRRAGYDEGVFLGRPFPAAGVWLGGWTPSGLDLIPLSGPRRAPGLQAVAPHRVDFGWKRVMEQGAAVADVDGSGDRELLFIIEDQQTHRYVCAL